MHQRECGTELLKRIKIGKKYKLVPLKVYVYSGITNSLQQFASWPGFFESCETWRSMCNVDGGFMTDVYDGKLWRDWNILSYLENCC